MAGAWTRKEGKNPKGGLNAKGRASLKAEGHDIKRPQPEGGKRRDSFCARMEGMKKAYQRQNRKRSQLTY